MRHFCCIYIWVNRLGKNPLTHVCVLACFLSGCVSATFLEKDKYLLTRQVVKGNKHNSQEEIEMLFQQKGNRKVLESMPYLYAYFAGKKFYKPEKIKEDIEKTKLRYATKIHADTQNVKRVTKLEAKRDKKLQKLQTKLDEGNWMMRVVGEPPVVLDTLQTQKTAHEIQTYLFNQGYFDARVSYSFKERFRKITITYQITENEPHKIYKVQYVTDDARIQHLLDSTAKQVSVKPDEIYKQNNLISERDRIDRLLRNSGYFAFSRKYISVVADTALPDTLRQKFYGTSLKFLIQNPANGRHKPYRINNIRFFIDNDRGTAPDTTWTYNQVFYKTNERDFSDKIVDTKILQHPPEWYSYSKIQNSQAQLASMDIYKFVNFNFDSTGGKLKLNIFTSRLPRYQVSDELGLVVSQGAPGPFVNGTFKVRNVFRYLGIFELGGRYSQEGQLSAFQSDRIYRATEWGFNASLSFPNALLPSKLSQELNPYSPRTRFIGGYTSVTRPEYARNIIKASLTYTIQTTPYSQIGVTPIDVSVNHTRNIDTDFRDFLITQAINGNSLIMSFNNSLVTSFGAYYMHNTNQTGSHKRSKYFRVNAEIGGLLPSFLNKTILKNNSEELFKLQYYRYVKVNADFRFYQPASKSTMIAARLNAGAAVPIGQFAGSSTATLPWEKYFFSGGSNSVRAWAPRRLGLGSYTYRDASGKATYQYEQAGNIIMEANIELRQKLFGFVETALFADAGNTWALTESEQNAGAQFRATRFWEQIALGVGAGLRLNFSFMIVRFDVSAKTYDPAETLNKRWVLHKWRDKGQTLLNVGIGYPF
ncbi:Outer membrane protein assembly factor BamA [Flexibacter flexilis DSM 6793]|uniref:Outer membrane protein assembly factor BamA n=1 Tax=Flexibacter flexilis DSM 6793 TaxID=927664 RepID=A0A1I1JJ24_9BACT|nr:BamA/TamA family outer membrane protein [Flexibacter flexilis]SFC48171.1 Outer membrane protein assembly factor BamA [Flexibacter flexilis DSM 6793]